jgi:hypothetical protein
MGAGAGQNKIVTVDLVEKQPIRLDVAITLSAPVACQGMILQARAEAGKSIVASL